MIRTDGATAVKPQTYMLVGFDGNTIERDFQIGIIEGLGYENVTIVQDAREASRVLQDLSKLVPDEVQFDLLRTSEQERRYLGALLQARKDLATLKETTPPEQAQIYAASQTPEGKRRVLETLVKQSLGIK